MLDLQIYALYKHHAWVGPQNNMQNMMGFVVTRQEFEHNLAKASQVIAGTSMEEEDVEQIQMIYEYLSDRLERSDMEKLPFIGLIGSNRLDEFQAQCLLLAFASGLDPKYEKLFAYLQDDVTRKRAGFGLAVQLFAEPGRVMASYQSYFYGGGSFSDLFDRKAWAGGELRLNDAVEDYLLGNPLRLEEGTALFLPEDAIQPLLIREEVSEALESLLGGVGRLALVCGAGGSGKRFLLRHALKRAGRKGVFADLARMEDVEEGVRQAALAARLSGAVLCLCHAETVGDSLEAALSSLPPIMETVFVLSREPVNLSGLSSRFILVEFSLEGTTEEERAKLFGGCAARCGLPMAEDVDLRELAVKFKLEPLQIQNAVTQAEGSARVHRREQVDAGTLHRSCYAQVIHKLGDLATKVKPAYSWEDLVLPAPQIKLMQEACAHIRHSYQVYNDWGFGGRVTYGRGLSMLFSGPPGTGKTMGAQVVANQLHMELYKIQLSQVVSKYIGETEKNLRAVFQEAKHSNCILFFDECDALFGKRAEVKDSHDRHANVETAYLLQQVEEHEGVTVMATNLLQNIDAAFMRRIGFVVHFPFPDKETRVKLYRSMLPERAPFSEDIDFDFLAEKFKVSGGSIKNIVLHAAFLAAAQGKPIGMEQMLNAAVNEMRKNEIIVAREDLREYADLIFS